MVALILISEITNSEIIFTSTFRNFCHADRISFRKTSNDSFFYYIWNYKMKFLKCFLVAIATRKINTTYCNGYFQIYNHSNITHFPILLFRIFKFWQLLCTVANPHGGRSWCTPPPFGLNFFIFMQILGVIQLILIIWKMLEPPLVKTETQ